MTNASGLVVVAGFALGLAGCGADGQGLGFGADGTRRASGSPNEIDVARGEPAPAPATPPPQTPTQTNVPPPTGPNNGTVIVRAEKLSASRIVARLIYAEKIEAQSAAITDLRRDEGKLWETEGAKADLAYDELRADAIYTKEIKVGALEAAQVFVKDLKVARGEDEDD